MAACQFLINKGLLLLEKNYRSNLGEIDLIMQDKEDIVFVEVRYRQKSNFGNAIETVNQTKIAKLIKTAKLYLQEKCWFYSKTSRFDIVTLQPVKGKLQLDWIQNAFLVDHL